MKRLKDYINECEFLQFCEDYTGPTRDLKLPHTFDVYNQGAKNRDFWITKKNIQRVFFGALTEIDKVDQMIRVELPAEEINYYQAPNAKNTKNWTKVPAIRECALCGGWYPDLPDGYSYTQWNKDWTKYLTSLFKERRGKISVTIDEDKEDNWEGWTSLRLSVNDEQFNKDREEKIKELSDPKHLEEWKDAADKEEKRRIEAEKKAIEDRKKYAERQEKAKEEWNKWWDSLSDAEQDSYVRGYGRGKYQGD